MSAHCTVCAHPDRADIDAKLAQGVPVLVISREHGLEAARTSLYRHVRAKHAPASAVVPHTRPNSQSIDSAPKPAQSSTQKDAKAAKREAMRHLRKAMKIGDGRIVNGAIQSLVKAIELSGKAEGELQSGANINVNVGVEAKVAMDAQALAQSLEPRDVIEEAGRLLGAYLEAGDAHARSTVLELVRMIPSADASDAAQSTEQA